MNLAPFKELIKQRCGLSFEGVGEAPLISGLQKRITQNGVDNASAYYAKLYSDDHEFHELVCLLTINETYFYREPAQLQLLVDCLIPRILSQKQDSTPLRILSAGCSTGEEPYSIAIALREKYGESAARLFHLAGGDIDKNALDKARTARYTEFSFRSLSQQLRDRYFEQHSKWAWDVTSGVRQQVHFHHLNLLDESYHHALQNYDIIFFRNVSIYFDAPTRRLIQQHLAALLKDNGSLIIGTTESLANDFGILNLVEENGQFYFAKQAGAPVRPQAKAPEFPANRSAATDWILPNSVPGLSRATEPRPAPPLPVPENPPVTVTLNIDEALRLTQEKQHDKAMSILNRLLEQQPDARTALLLKAYILLHRKDYSAAEKLAEQVLKIDAWSIDAFMLLGLAAKWREQTAGAVKWFKQAVYACNECWPAHYYLAEIYRATGETEKAQRAYRVVLNLLSGQQEAGDGLSVIPLDLPTANVRFLCEHQTAKLGERPAAVR